MVLEVITFLHNESFYTEGGSGRGNQRRGQKRISAKDKSEWLQLSKLGHTPGQPLRARLGSGHSLLGAGRLE